MCAHGEHGFAGEHQSHLFALHGLCPCKALELVRALAAHCPSVAESAALWGQPGLSVLSAYLRSGNETALREAAAAALDAILRLHKIQAVKEVLAKGMRIRGLLDKYGEALCSLLALRCSFAQDC